MVKIALCAC